MRNAVAVEVVEWAEAVVQVDLGVEQPPQHMEVGLEPEVADPD